MSKTTLYTAIWGILVAATILEVLTRSLPAAFSLVVIGIIAISTFKAVLIASFYQNLRYEVKALAIVPIFAVVTLSVLLATAILGG